AATALKDAMELLEQLGPADSNDPETVGLAGAIEKRLFELGHGSEHLDRAIRYYARGYFLRNDWYNAINLAFLLDVRSESELHKTDADRTADAVWARRIRHEALQLVEAELGAAQKRQAEQQAAGSQAPVLDLLQAQEKRTWDRKFWLLATKAEAQLG